MERRKNKEIKGRISSSSLILVDTIHLPTVNVYTTFQSSMPHSSREKCDEKFQCWKLERKKTLKKKTMKKPEDHWSCIAHLIAEDMLKSAVIEQKTFKHSPWAGADNPLGPKFWCQQVGLITMVICCKFRKNPFNFWLYTHLFMNVYSRRSGADNPRGQNFDVNRNLLSLQSFATSFKKNLFEVWFYTIFFMILYMYIHVAPGQGLTTPRGWNFYVNRNILSLWSFVASCKKNLFEVILCNFFSGFYTCI